MASHKNHKIKQNSLPFSAHFMLQSQGSAKNPRGHKITENELLMFPLSLSIYMYIVVNLNHDWHSRPNSLSFNSCVAIDPNFFQDKKTRTVGRGRAWKFFDVSGARNPRPTQVHAPVHQSSRYPVGNFHLVWRFSQRPSPFNTRSKPLRQFIKLFEII